MKRYVVSSVSSLREYPLNKPLIAAVNGACFAAGAELLLATDIRLSAAHATFAWPEVSRGVIPFAGSLVRLPRQVPHCLAMEMLLTGGSITAAEAHRIGLVNHVVEADQVMPKARSLADRVAANGPLAIQQVKRTVRDAMGRSLPFGYRLEDESKRIVFASDDAKEGPRAFLEKRAPRFRGR